MDNDTLHYLAAIGEKLDALKERQTQMEKMLAMRITDLPPFIAGDLKAAKLLDISRTAFRRLVAAHNICPITSHANNIRIWPTAALLATATKPALPDAPRSRHSTKGARP
jgi:hypothetical protein